MSEKSVHTQIHPAVSLPRRKCHFQLTVIFRPGNGVPVNCRARGGFILASLRELDSPGGNIKAARETCQLPDTVTRLWDVLARGRVRPATLPRLFWTGRTTHSLREKSASEVRVYAGLCSTNTERDRAPV